MMPLEAIIATPSGPFGELIRLTLEADPTFRCTLLDRGEELWAALQTSVYQAVIYDCSCSLPGPEEVSKILRAEYPTTALLFIPSETNPNIENLLNLSADGTISRPFDASLLPELIKNAVDKRTGQQSGEVPFRSDFNEKSWLEILQAEIQGSAAAHGILVQNKAVAAATPEVSLNLQEQILADISEHWNPSDTSDLMRFIKDLDSNLEWMIYATQVIDSVILVLLFEPQTPVTRVRILTIQVARQLAFRKTRMIPHLEADEQPIEFQNPPKLHEILGEIPENEQEQPKNPGGFPIEWFKEADISISTNEKNHEVESAVPSSFSTASEIGTFADGQTIDTPGTVEAISEIPADLPLPNGNQQKEDSFSPIHFSIIDNDEATPENTGYHEHLESDSFDLSESSSLQADIDLGSFQPVDLIAETPGAAGLDSLQPVTLASHLSPEMHAEGILPDESTSQETANSSDDGSTETAAFAEIEFPKVVQNSSGHSSDNEILDPESGAIKIIKEPEISASKEFDITDAIPEDLTAIPVFENLPYFHNPSISEIPVFEAKEKPTEAMEAALTPFGLDEYQPGGEPAMKNIDEQTTNSDPDQNDREPVKTANSVDQSPEVESNLFSRMNQLQNSAPLDGTETITVALIPLQESFILQRQIAGMLNQCMTRLCQAFGWTLDDVTIRPTYLQWTVTIPNLFTPEDMTSIVRKQTSQTLFENIPDLQQQTSGDDIWAAESMMASGKDFIPSSHWQNFILRRKNDEIA